MRVRRKFWDRNLASSVHSISVTQMWYEHQGVLKPANGNKQEGEHENRVLRHAQL